MGSEVRVLQFGVLGPLEVLRAGKPVRLGGRQQRALLALLLMHANELVRIDHLAEALSGEQLSEAGVNAVRVSISRLRQVLRDGTDCQALQTHPGGYVLAVGPAEFDLALFEHLMRQAHESLAAEQLETAASLLREALA